MVKSLNLIEIWFGILNAKCLKNGNFKSVEEMIHTIHDFVTTWTTYFAHPFRWTYTGEDLPGKAVRRFSKVLAIESQQLSKKHLKKQLSLMINLIADYWSRIPKRYWEELLGLIASKDVYINKIVENDQKIQPVLADLKRLLSEKLGPLANVSACA